MRGKIILIYIKFFECQNNINREESSGCLALEKPKMESTSLYTLDHPHGTFTEDTTVQEIGTGLENL